MKDYDISSGRSIKRKKKNKLRRILANIVGSIILLGSIVTLAGMILLNTTPFDSDKDDYKSIYKSPSENVSYILIVGLDKTEKLTDVIMLMCYDIKNNAANILQIPRDSYVGTELNTDYTTKINAVYGNPEKGESGINALKRVLNNQFGLPVDHHVIINLDALKSIVDTVGGVEIVLDKDLELEDFRTGKRSINLKAGKVTLDGNLAESFMRERRTFRYQYGDIDRVRNQRRFYAGFASKISKMSITKLASIGAKNMDKIKTDMSLGEIMGYAKAVKSLDIEKIGIFIPEGYAGDYKPPGYRDEISLFSVDTNAYIDLVYAHMNPYDSINYDGINIQQFHKGEPKTKRPDETIGELLN